MIILGAGMAGCLAGVVNPSATILESSDGLQINHKAVLRFRTDAVSKATGIPFKKVRVHKSIYSEGKHVPLNPRLANYYSQKVLGIVSARSINNIDPCDRYVAPPDFHQQLISMCGSRIEYNSKVTEITDSAIQTTSSHIPRDGSPIISTIPMPVLGRILHSDITSKVNFNFKPILTSRYKVQDCDVHQTIYYPDLDTTVYRATLTGSDLIIESIRETFGISEVLDSFGIHKEVDPVCENHIQKYGKIQEIDSTIRRAFIHLATLKYRIYSLGRFATWRNILLDDVLDDLSFISRIQHEDIYSHLLEI